MSMPNLQIISAQAALDTTCRTLRVTAAAADNDTPHEISQADLVMQLAAAMARRLSGFMCPCSPREIVTAVERSLSHLPVTHDQVRDVAKAAIEDLLASGDLLALDHVKLIGAEHEPNWLFCAPPSFIPRAGRIYITGIGPDDASILPITLRERVVSQGATRFISVDPDDGDLELTLASHGLRRLDPQRWLTLQRPVKADSFVNTIQRRLLSEGSVGHLDGLKVLARRRAGRGGYRARWHELKDESGLHVARLPKAYGAPLWVLIDVDRGVVKRSQLLPLKGSRCRACDDAWRLQLAIDANDGHAATYRVQREQDGSMLSLDFPLPAEARRRLVLIGGRRRTDASHLSFWIPQSQLETEERYLQEQLWFRRADISKGVV